MGSGKGGDGDLLDSSLGGIRCCCPGGLTNGPEVNAVIS